MPIMGVPVVIAAIYKTNAGQSIPHGGSHIIDFEDKVVDTHNAVTTGATWKFTAPMSGFYLVGGIILFASTATWADGEVGGIDVCINAVIETVLDRKDNYGSAEDIMMFLEGSTLLHLNAGDYVDLRIYQSSGAALSLFGSSAYNRVFIVKYAGT